MAINRLDISAGVVSGLRDVARLPLYSPSGEAAPAPVPGAFTTDGDFWHAVLDRTIREATAVALNGFVLSKWVPRSPGTYWKAESQLYRQAAQKDVIDTKKYKVYGPRGKSLQVLGGVGSVRMAPSGQSRLMSASGLPRGWNGVWSGTPHIGHTMPSSWTGVPVLLEREAYAHFQTLPDLMRVNVRGVLTALPQEYAKWLFGNEGVPRVCLSVGSPEQLTVLEDPPRQSWYETCSWTLFEYAAGATALRQYDYTYFHHNLFEPDEAKEAVTFIRDYVKERNGTMLTDFDAVEPQLDALLPIGELQNSEVNRARLRDLIQRVKNDVLSENEVRYDRIPELLVEHFNSAKDLRQLASDHLNLSLDELIGKDAGVVPMVEALVKECRDRGRMPDLACGMLLERPALSDQLAVP